jgi:toxin ParE1/3/4
MKRFTYTPRADADLDAITDYFAEHNPDAGIRLLDAITARCRVDAHNPRSGLDRSDLAPGVRTAVVDRYVIFFRALANGIDVLRVLHGSRDITADTFDD